MSFRTVRSDNSYRSASSALFSAAEAIPAPVKLDFVQQHVFANAMSSYLDKLCLRSLGLEISGT